ncbi:MAG: hypothetical protein EPN30_02770, partial [Actinomycetota bacterium]
MRLFDPFELYQFGQMAAANPERDSYHKRIATELARSGPYKKYTFEQNVLEKLCELRSTAPNFTVVTECVIDAVCLAVECAKPIRITPILLVG